VNHKITPENGDAVRYLCLPYKQGNGHFLQQLTWYAAYTQNRRNDHKELWQRNSWP